MIKPPGATADAASDAGPAARGYFVRVKFTSTCVATSTGSPFNKVVEYSHCWTAGTAAPTNKGCPSTTSISFTLPSLSMTTLRRTRPWMRCSAGGRRFRLARWTIFGPARERHLKSCSGEMANSESRLVTRRRCASISPVLSEEKTRFYVAITVQSVASQ